MTSLWACPSCNRQFANPNQWHSCIKLALDEHLESKTELAVRLYREFEEAVRSCGEYRIHAQKTRIAFISRMTFASISLATRWVDVSFITPTPVADARLRRIGLYGPTSFNHEVRVGQLEEIGPDLRGWLCEAHRRGRQETLDPTADVEPLSGTVLEKVLVPLRSRIVAGPDELAFKLPKYAGQAFANHRQVLAKVAGDRYPGEVISHDKTSCLVLAENVIRSLGLGLGDDVDVFVEADI